MSLILKTYLGDLLSNLAHSSHDVGSVNSVSIIVDEWLLGSLAGAIKELVDGASIVHVDASDLYHSKVSKIG